MTYVQIAARETSRHEAEQCRSKSLRWKRYVLKRVLFPAFAQATLTLLTFGCSTSMSFSNTSSAAPPVTASSTANNAELNGTYAFGFTGVSGSASNSGVYAAVGRFTADGAGNITNGELDINGAAQGAGLIAQPFTGTYSIGTDHRGVMTLNIGGSTATLTLAMMADGNAQFIKFDATGGSGAIGSGTMEKVDTSAFSTTSIAGDYAFGVAGLDNLNNRAAIAGRFTSNGAGALSNAAGDVNAYGSVSSMSFTSANYTVTDAATGRGTMNLSFSFAGGAASLNFVFYIVNAGKLLVMERDPVATATPLLTGTVLRQQSPTGGFSNASLNGNMVIYLTGLSTCSNITGRVPKATAGLLTANGIGGFTLTFDENFCRAPNSVSSAPGAYTVASNGRTSITLATDSVIAYLVGSNEAFLFSTDTSVLSGFCEPQAATPLANAALMGTYSGVATNPVGFGVVTFSGEFTADGSSPVGNITGVEDIGDPSGPVSGSAFSATYSVSSAPTNGRGTMNIPSGSGTNAVIYTISPSKFVVVPLSDPNPAVWVFEQPFSTAAAPTLSTLTLNPTSVVGGVQSSTGTVTLSAAAPSGGAQVALSSSSSAAGVPATVTIPAGATSASFTVSTQAVAASTAVSISASYGGTTQTASLTVTPAPLPTLTSLTLNPTSVVGGVQSSTGTVTLSAAAPSGGAHVALSSSSSAAGVPATVTIPAGATSASFTISTSIVLLATSATISASYNNTTQSATLSVLL